MPTTVGIDIGGSSVKAVVRSTSGEVIARHETPASFSDGPEVVEAAVAAYHALDAADCLAVGIGIPGQVDGHAGRVSFAVNLGIGVESFDLASHIESRLGLPVRIENDVRAAVLGVQELLANRGLHPGSLALVSIGTGVSAGVLVDGALIRGSRGMAGEIGHVVLDEAGPGCRCGQRGCLEMLVSGPAIARVWPRVPEDVAATSLFAAAAEGDQEAEQIASAIAGHLTTALIWLAAAYDTELMVLGGGVASAGESFIDLIRAEITRRGAASELASRRLAPEQVVLADPFDLPGSRGAALIAAKTTLHEAVSTRRTKQPTSKQQGGAV